MAIGEKDVRQLLAMVGMLFDAEDGEVRRAKILAVDGESADGDAVTVCAEVIEPDVFGFAGVGRIEEPGVAVVAIEVTPLRLVRADFGEFDVGVDDLINTRAEQDFWLGG